ncbi:MAG TPA: histidine kinase dimerization/phospho-acceptor domain-containing protein [Novosphingobium sp.]|nr:histidine kinase dimerization/phospho-acceptor domain-containing protein [Novosphingobium sp.]
MHFDDRLGTVLRLNASSEAMRRIQFRQLLDLLGVLPADARGEQIDAAFVRLGELSKAIPAGLRTAVVRDVGLRLRSPRLVAALASGEPDVAQAALQRAELTREEWHDLIPALPPGARHALRRRSDLPRETVALLARLGVTDRGLPPAAAPAPDAPAAEATAKPETAPEPEPAAAAPAEEPQPQPEPEPEAEPVSALEPEPAASDELPTILPAQPAPGDGAIGAIVKRIEAFRRARQVVEQRPANDSPRLPLGEEHVLQVPEQIRAFNFATDAEGRITWSDPGVAPMVTGIALPPAASDPAFAVRLRSHQPLTGQRLRLAGAPAIAGEWCLDAAPWFDPLTGRYLGYRGRLRRPAERVPLVPPVTDSEADRLRQLLHELRTPVNAIQGFAEVIQQQLFGPTPHDYRALAAGIAGDAARMLAAFEELERLARLDSGAMELDPGETDLAAMIEATASQLAAHTGQRGSGFAIRREVETLPVGLERIEVERIVWRLLATLAGVSAPGEMLKLRLRERHGMARIDLALPKALADRPEESLFETAAGAIPQIITAGVFGVGFALRLARAEARAAGGDLIRRDGKLRLTLPGLTGDSGDHRQQQAGGADAV